MHTPLSEAVWQLEEGYCLWVGAGLSVQIASGKAVVPLWKSLIVELESIAGVGAALEGVDLPSRLDRCFAALGERRFNVYLRQRYYTELCVGLLSHASDALSSGRLVPEHIRPVAALGQLANPIVSFNIEPLSTLLLARPAGPVRVVYQQVVGKSALTWRESGGKFQRLAYHPHGVATADTVMTSSQYSANSQTLAFALAIHSAFGNNLAIVGMSLDDQFLKDQITKHRAGLKSVLWFNSQFSTEDAAWSVQNKITLVTTPWAEFWSTWTELPIEVDDDQLLTAWYLAVSEATEECEGGHLGGTFRGLAASSSKAESAEFHRLASDLAHAGTKAGESGTEIDICGRNPRSIELELREVLMAKGIQTPTISHTFDPGASRDGAA